MTTSLSRTFILAGDDAFGAIDRSVESRDPQKVILVEDLTSGELAYFTNRGAIAIDNREILSASLIVLDHPLLEVAALVTGLPVTNPPVTGLPVTGLPVTNRPVTGGQRYVTD